jgi:LPXTG-motif cell wall-anchored protein
VSGGDLVIGYTAAALVPEPTTGLAGLAAAGLAAVLLRRRKAA